MWTFKNESFWPRLNIFECIYTTISKNIAVILIEGALLLQLLCVVKTALVGSRVKKCSHGPNPI